MHPAQLSKGGKKIVDGRAELRSRGGGTCPVRANKSKMKDRA